MMAMFGRYSNVFAGRIMFRIRQSTWDATLIDISIQRINQKLLGVFVDIYCGRIADL